MPALMPTATPAPGQGGAGRHGGPDLIRLFWKSEATPENITQLKCALAVQAYEHYTGEELPPMKRLSDTNDPIVAVIRRRLCLGYEDGTFRPDRLLTRQEFFVFVSRFSRPQASDPAEHGEDLAGFVDAGASAPGWTPPGRW
ncbi:MAG: S-layer homology domain-containing protein [Oscillospiraceae bacterium]